MSSVPDVKKRTEVRDGMRIIWQQPIPADDGIVLRADVFRPIEDGHYPVILSYGVYAKGLAFQEGYPHHPHDRVEPLTPGEVYECDVEIVTSCIVVPAGWRVALTVRGKDYEYEGEVSAFGQKVHDGTRGTGGMTHADADDRPADVFGGKVTLYAGGSRDSYLLLPIIPTP